MKRFGWLALASALFFLLPLRFALAADPPITVTADELNAKIKEVAATTELDEATRASLTELYRRTLTYLEAARSNKQAAEAFSEARKTASAEAEKIRQKIEQIEGPIPAGVAGVSAQTPLSDIEPLLATEKANLAAVEAKLAELEEKLSGETERPNAARKRLAETRQRQAQLAAELKLPAPAGELPAMTEARRWLREFEALALSTETHMLDEELLSQPMRIALLEAQRDEAAKSAERILAGVKLLEDISSERRLLEAEESEVAAEEAEREAQGKHSLIQKLAADNATLSEELTALAARLEQVSGEDDVATREAKRISDIFRSARQKLEIAGLSQALGQVLQEQRRALPNLRLFRKEARDREELIADASFAQIHFAEERRRLRDLDGYVANLVTDLPAEEADEIRDELGQLASSRRVLLDKGTATNNAYLLALGELDFARSQLLEAAQAYDDFLAERLLWIRSGPAISLATLPKLPQQAALLVSPVQWLTIGKTLFARATASPLLLLGVAVVGILLWKRRRLGTALRETGTAVGKATDDRFSATSHALLWSLLLAAPWPLLMATLGWQLGQALDTTVFTKAVSAALLAVSPALFYLLSFRVICAPGGLAAIHFRWPEASLARLRQALFRLTVVLPPTGFVAVLVITSDALGGVVGLGRLALIVVLIALAMFLYPLFDPRQGVLVPFMTRHPRGTLARLRHLWFGLAIGIPLALAGLTVYGYMYTAGKLTGALFETMWLIFGLVVIHQLAVRWLLLVQRRLAFEAALERRTAARASREAEAAAHAEVAPVSDEIPDEVVEPEVDLVALSEEGRELLTMGLAIVGIMGVWLIWSEVLPAFGILDQVSLWHQTRIVEGQETLVPTTLADIGLAILVLVVTVVATRRFPALLEIALLQRLDMTSGGRYAATTLSSYLIVGIGAVVVFNIVGFNWSKLQWLVAALGVGIGFGLQEIVANFISGLIILFERPVRVGDIVTVGDTDGVVTRIRIRATTIRNWDRKELLVPNKEFITGRLLNWSLSDQTTRLLIPVGVAYGSDVQKAMALMAEAAEENERVLSDPMPFVTFEGFGDNALALNLRAYIGSLDYRVTTISELHEAINQKMNEAGIVIAFPQRDVHLDTSQPLDIRIRRDDVQPNTDSKS